MQSSFTLTTQRTARVEVRAHPAAANVQTLWIACHGYGMPVDRFADWFLPLLGENAEGTHAVFCPEGLSRFYWGAFDGPPVASWMTRAARLHEIEDFCAYLDEVYAKAKAVYPTASVVLFGFSQGAATIMRWTQRRRPAYDRIVLWSGTPPEDIDYAPLAYYPPHKLHSRWGNEDELVAWSRAQIRFEEVGLPFRHRHFAGGHRITPDALCELARALQVELHTT